MQSVLTSHELQKTSGDALWEAIKIAITPSFLAGKPKSGAAKPPAKPSPASAPVPAPSKPAPPPPSPSAAATPPQMNESEFGAWSDSISDEELAALERLAPDLPAELQPPFMHYDESNENHNSAAAVPPVPTPLSPRLEQNNDDKSGLPAALRYPPPPPSPLLTPSPSLQLTAHDLADNKPKPAAPSAAVTSASSN
jgi:hypothetical protein